jgi:hypothetical protein
MAAPHKADILQYCYSTRLDTGVLEYWSTTIVVLSKRFLSEVKMKLGIPVWT